MRGKSLSRDPDRIIVMSEELHKAARTPTRMSRAIHLLLTVVIAVAFVGFFVGIRQGKTVPDVSPVQREQVVAHPQAIPATAWRDYDRRRYGPNRDWQNTLASLRVAPLDPAPWGPASAADRQAVQAVRASRRAFPGAPPVVPHPIDQMSTASCLACHAEGLSIGKGVRAPKMSHALLTNCTQCHVELESPDLGPVKIADNTFYRMESPTAGNRAWPGAPPVIPHSTWMRETCLSCHGPTGPAAIHTSHPTRVSCRQCHGPSAVLDQVVTEDQPAWLTTEEGLSARSEMP
jgi:cytochrome c-type protein NapB